MAEKNARTKSSFVACRFEPNQQRKLRALAVAMGAGGNMSAALRALVDQAPEPSRDAVIAGLDQWQEGEAAHG